MPVAVGRAEQLEQLGFDAVVGTRRVAGRGADAGVVLADQVVGAELFERGVAPELAADALVEVFGERLGEAVGERLEQICRCNRRARP